MILRFNFRLKLSRTIHLWSTWDGGWGILAKKGWFFKLSCKCVLAYKIFLRALIFIFFMVIFSGGVRGRGFWVITWTDDCVCECLHLGYRFPARHPVSVKRIGSEIVISPFSSVFQCSSWNTICPLGDKVFARSTAFLFVTPRHPRFFFLPSALQCLEWLPLM